MYLAQRRDADAQVGLAPPEQEVCEALGREHLGLVHVVVVHAPLAGGEGEGGGGGKMKGG